MGVLILLLVCWHLIQILLLCSVFLVKPIYIWRPLFVHLLLVFMFLLISICFYNIASFSVSFLFIFMRLNERKLVYLLLEMSLMPIVFIMYSFFLFNIWRWPGTGIFLFLSFLIN